MDVNTSSCNCGTIPKPCKMKSCISQLTSLPEVCRKWQIIGLELGINTEKLEQIESKCGSEAMANNFFQVMLTEWLNENEPQHGHYACCSPLLTLIEILGLPHVGLNHIASEIKKKLGICTCSSETNTTDRDEVYKGEVPETNNPKWETSLNLSTAAAKGLGVPDESRVKEFRTESELAKKTRQLENEFFQVIVKTLEFLENSDVSIHTILSCLGKFEDTERLMMARSVDHFFELLGPCISWFNYALLEAVIEEFTTKEVQQAMHCYVSQLKSTLEERRVSELPPDIYKQVNGKHSNPKIVENNRKIIGVKLDYEWSKFLVKDAQIMRQRIASILGVEKQSLFLLSVTEGCVFLEFLVPEFLSEEILSIEITPDMRSEFERVRAIEVVCDSVLIYSQNKIQNDHDKYTYPSCGWLFNELIQVS